MLYVSGRAEAELRKTLESSPAPGARFRVFIDHLCNCGRARFGIRVDARSAEGDTAFEVGGIPFVTDSETLPQLRVAEVDYANDWMERGLVVRNIDQCPGC
jgi:Fe-S cluster assembly iron-binding protein IscA